MLDLNFIRVQLDEAYERLADEYVRTSVLSVVREYAPVSSADLESWALLGAVLDFQVSVTQHLIPMLRGLLKAIEERNLKFIDLIYDEDTAFRILSSFSWKNNIGFRHRFLKIEHILALLRGVRDLLESYRSIGELIKYLYMDALMRNLQEPLEYVIKEFAKILRDNISKYLNNEQVLGRLIPNPYGQSSFKRLCLYFRWLVRPYPDLNIWNFIDKKYLYVSLDIGVIRVLSRAFGMRISRPDTWEAVKYVTSFLRKINPDDPAKYDYVLSRPSIMGYCKKDFNKRTCMLCPLSAFCLSAKIPGIRSVPLRSREESNIFRRFLQMYGDKLGIDRVFTEYSVGDFSIDAVIHSKDCTWYVVEVERRLNDTAIGQVIKYKTLLYKYRGIHAKPLIICESADERLIKLLNIDAGIQVIVVPPLKSSI